MMEQNKVFIIVQCFKFAGNPPGALLVICYLLLVQIGVSNRFNFSPFSVLFLPNNGISLLNAVTD